MLLKTFLVLLVMCTCLYGYKHLSTRDFRGRTHQTPWSRSYKQVLGTELWSSTRAVLTEPSHQPQPSSLNCRPQTPCGISQLNGDVGHKTFDRGTASPNAQQPEINSNPNAKQIWAYLAMLAHAASCSFTAPRLLGRQHASFALRVLEGYSTPNNFA